MALVGVAVGAQHLVARVALVVLVTDGRLVAGSTLDSGSTPQATTIGSSTRGIGAVLAEKNSRGRGFLGLGKLSDQGGGVQGQTSRGDF